MRVEEYLERIRYDGPRAPSAEALRRLHRAHMLSVPFENLDIHLGRPIALDVPAFYRKIVEDRRGGFCYELNGALAWLLGTLGYRVTLHSARVFSGDRPGEEFDHLALLVDLGGRWLADVGFGDSFLEPLRLAPDAAVEQAGWRYGLRRARDGWTLRRRRGGGAWEPSYAFSPAPHRLKEFAARCAFHQTSPESHFTRNTICSIATARGRISISGRRLIVTDGERREEREIGSPEEYRAILERDFGMKTGGMDVARLMAGTPAV